MLVVETIGRIRREHFVQGKSIKEIARDLRLSRNTVRKVLRSDETSFSYERQVQPRPKLGRWKEQLDRLLAANVEAPARERLTLIRIFEELRALGYDGGYDAIRRYARSWAKANATATADAFVPLTFAPGEAYQFDSHGGVRVKTDSNPFHVVRYPWSEPKLHDTARFRRRFKLTYGRRVNGCTNIPRARGDGSGERDHSGARHLGPNRTSVRPPGSARIDRSWEIAKSGLCALRRSSSPPPR
jgi:transposase